MVLYKQAYWYAVFWGWFLFGNELLMVSAISFNWFETLQKTHKLTYLSRNMLHYLFSSFLVIRQNLKRNSTWRWRMECKKNLINQGLGRGGQTKKKPSEGGVWLFFLQQHKSVVMYRVDMRIPSIPGVACPCIMCWGSSLFPGSPLHPTNNNMGMLYTLGTASDIRGFTMLPNPEF